jgi:hypothetical protein
MSPLLIEFLGAKWKRHFDFSHQEIFWHCFYFSLQRFHHRCPSFLLVKQEAGGTLIWGVNMSRRQRVGRQVKEQMLSSDAPFPTLPAAGVTQLNSISIV